MVAALSIILLTAVTSAAHSGETEIQPLNKTVIDSNSSINGSNISKNELPFPVEVEDDSITANVSLNYPAQSYTGEVVLENNYTHSYTVDVQRSTDWNLSKDGISEVVNVGTSGRFTNQSISLEGNSNASISTEVSGNVSEFLDVTDEVTVFPGVDSRIVVSYQVPRTTEYGNYTGVLNLTGSYGEFEEVPLDLQFKDSTTPEVESVDTPSFDATFPEEFTVEASDNIGVDAVQGTVLKEVVNNGTVENQSVTSLEFDSVNNSDSWIVTPPGSENGTYYLQGQVVDEAGNNVSFNSSYQVRALDAIDVDQSLDLRNYRVESEILEKFGRINRSTRTNIRLESFSQGLQSSNETWTVAVETSNGKQFLRDEGSTVTVEGPTDLELFVYSDSAERFNGRLSFNPEDNVPVEDVSFSGSYLECTVPKERTFNTFNKSISYSPVNSENCANAGWNVSYFVSANSISTEADLEDSTRIYIPEQVEENIVQNWKSRVEDKEQQLEDVEQEASSEDFWGKVTLLMFVGALGWVYWEKKEAPSFYYVKLDDTKSLSDKIGSSDDDDGLI